MVHRIIRMLHRRPTTGELLLALYVLIVIAFSVLQLRFGRHIIQALASSPDALLHGKWWTLITSGFIIDGPRWPQVAAILSLGIIAIATSGAWVFWRVAITGHVFGTLAAYLGLWLAWIVNPGHLTRWLSAPDYGVSLIWCSALGAIAAIAWRGTNRQAHFRPFLPTTFVGCLVILLGVTWLSTGLATYEHISAFILGYIIMYAHKPSRLASTKALTAHPLAIRV